MRSKTDQTFIASLERLNFTEQQVKDELASLFDNEVIEESAIRDTYAQIFDGEPGDHTEANLTTKGEWLMTISQWPQYEAIFTPPKKTLFRGGPVFERRVLLEFAEMIGQMVLFFKEKPDNYRLAWPALFEAFCEYAEELPPEHGQPGKSGFEEQQLYRLLNKAGLIRVDMSNYPNHVVINRVTFENWCDQTGPGILEENPFVDKADLAERFTHIFGGDLTGNQDKDGD